MTHPAIHPKTKKSLLTICYIATLASALIGCSTLQPKTTLHTPPVAQPSKPVTVANTAPPTTVAAIQNPIAAEPIKPILAKVSPFLKDLTKKDLVHITAQASRTSKLYWQRVDARSQKVRHRILHILDNMNAPIELQFIPVAESSYRPYALSPVGASGLWQLMPNTGKELGASHHNGIDGRRDVEVSTKAAVTYLLNLHQRFDSWPLAICAYNLGPWGVERRLRKKPWTPEMGLNALPFPSETKHYVKEVLGLIALHEQNKIRFSAPLITQSTLMQAPLDLNHLEAIVGLDKKEIFHLNPKLDFQHYLHRDIHVTLPEEHALKLQQLLKQDPEMFKPKYISVTIKSGDSLWLIARRYHTNTSQLQRLNPQLKKVLLIGQTITVPTPSQFSQATSKTNPLLSQGRRVRYKVRNGDSLWKIAKKFGTSTRAIARSNQMSIKKLIRPGDKLWIIARFQPS